MGLVAHQISPIVKEWEKMRGLLAFEVSNKQYPSFPIKFGANWKIKFSNQADENEIVSFGLDEADVMSLGSAAPAELPNITCCHQLPPHQLGQWLAIPHAYLSTKTDHTMFSLLRKLLCLLSITFALWVSINWCLSCFIRGPIEDILLHMLFLSCSMISLW